MPQRRVRVRLERRHADVGGGERGRHRVVGQRAGEATRSGRSAATRASSARPLRAVADQDGAPRRSARARARQRVDQAPTPCQARKAPANTATGRRGCARERHRAGGAGRKRPRVRAPLGLDDLRRPACPAAGSRASVVTIRSAARHCHSRQRRIGSARSRRSSGALGRAGVVDDRRVHLEHGARADRARGEQALAAEVVVALDDDVGPHAAASARRRPRRSSRRFGDPSGAPDACQRGRRDPAARPSPRPVATWTSWPSAASLGAPPGRASSRPGCPARPGRSRRRECAAQTLYASGGDESVDR